MFCRMFLQITCDIWFAPVLPLFSRHYWLMCVAKWSFRLSVVCAFELHVSIWLLCVATLFSALSAVLHLLQGLSWLLCFATWTVSLHSLFVSKSHFLQELAWHALKLRKYTNCFRISHPYICRHHIISFSMEDMHLNKELRAHITALWAPSSFARVTLEGIRSSISYSI